MVCHLHQTRRERGPRICREEGSKDMCMGEREIYTVSLDGRPIIKKRIIEISTVEIPLVCPHLGRTEYTNRNVFPQQMH
jgi:hypothetical protein